MIATRMRMAAGGGAAGPLPVPSFRAATTSGPAFAASRTSNLPTGTAAGDMLLAFLLLQAFSYPTVTAPAGWTLVHRVPSGNERLEVWSKTATGSEPSDYTFSWSGGGRNCILHIAAYQPASGTITVGAVTQGTNTTVQTHIFPSITPEDAPSTLLCAMASANAATGFAPDSSMAERIDYPATHHFYLQDQALSSASATGTRSAVTTSPAVSSTALSFVLYEV